MRIYAGLILFAAYFLWILYRAIIKKDLRQHREALTVYSGFIMVWAVIYACMIFL